MPDFNAKEVAVVIDGEVVALLDSVGYDQSNENELDRSLEEDGYVWIDGDDELTGTVAVKAVSESIPDLEELYQEKDQFTLSVSYADAEPRENSQFIDCKFQEWGPADDYENSSMPMYEGSWEAAKVKHNN